MNESSKLATFGATDLVGASSHAHSLSQSHCGPVLTPVATRHSHAEPTPTSGAVLPAGGNGMIAPMLAELVQRYPTMFEAEHVGLDMVGGWYPVFAQLCADIDAMVGPSGHGFGWLQLKEKYGLPRWYWRMSDANDLSLAVPPAQTRQALEDSVRDLVHAAETKCESHCMACGQPASLQRLKGWFTTCCSAHLEMLTLEPAAFWRLAEQKPR